MAIQPKFSENMKKLAYVSTTKEFYSHTTCYELKVYDFETKQVELIIPICEEADEEFAGLYGYNFSYLSTGFLASSDRYFLISSEYKCQERVYLVDTKTK
jgi:hypothetical protein